MSLVGNDIVLWGLKIPILFRELKNWQRGTQFWLSERRLYLQMRDSGGFGVSARSVGFQPPSLSNHAGFGVSLLKPSFV
jgi:hypothetical protein